MSKPKIKTMEADNIMPQEDFAEMLDAKLKGDTLVSVTIDIDYYRFKFKSGESLLVRTIAEVYLQSPRPL